MRYAIVVEKQGLTIRLMFRIYRDALQPDRPLKKRSGIFAKLSSCISKE